MSFTSLREWMDLVAREIGRDEFVSLLRALAFWGCLGVVLGVALGVAAYRFFRHCGWYGATSSFGRWLQRALGAIIALVCAAALGIAGLYEGAHRQCHDLVTRSRIGADLLPPVADIVAEGLAWIDLALQSGSVPAFDDARLAEFQAGKREIDAAAFLQRIDALETGVFQQLLARFERHVLEKAPVLKGGLSEKLLHQTIQVLGPSLLKRQLSSELRRHKLDRLQAAIRAQLVAEAGLGGDPATIGHRELSRFVLREGIVPAVVFPLRSLVRQQQVVCILFALFAAFAPAGLCRVFRSKEVPVTPLQPPDAAAMSGETPG